MMQLGRGYPLGETIQTSEIDDNSITLAKQAHGTQGGVQHYGAAGAPSELAAGSAGQALLSGGAGADVVWGSAGNLVELGSTTLGGTSSTITVDSLSTSTYKMLKIVGYIGDSNASGAGSCKITFNDDTGSNYFYHLFSDSTSADNKHNGAAATSANAGTPSEVKLGWFEMDIFNVSGVIKSFVIHMHQFEDAAGNTNIFHECLGFWENTGANITKIVLTDGGRTFMTGSRIIVYGVS